MGTTSPGSSPTEVGYSVRTRAAKDERSTTYRATARGPGALAWVEGRRPGGPIETAEVLHEEAIRYAEGTWVVKEPAPDEPDKPEGVRWQIQTEISGGHVDFDFEPVVGGFEPVLFEGAILPWRLSLTLKGRRRGGEGKPEELKLPGLLSSPWLLDRNASREKAPFVAEFGADPDSHLWAREASLVYWSASKPTGSPAAQVRAAQLGAREVGPGQGRLDEALSAQVLTGEVGLDELLARVVALLRLGRGPRQRGEHRRQPALERDQRRHRRGRGPQRHQVIGQPLQPVEGAPQLRRAHGAELARRAEGDPAADLEHAHDRVLFAQAIAPEGLLAVEAVQRALGRVGQVRELGELDLALNALRAVTLSKSEDGPMSRAEAFLMQAKIAHQKGEGRRALLWARKAKSEDPQLEEAQAFLEQLGDG